MNGSKELTTELVHQLSEVFSNAVTESGEEIKLPHLHALQELNNIIHTITKPTYNISHQITMIIHGGLPLKWKCWFRDQFSQYRKYK